MPPAVGTIGFRTGRLTAGSYFYNIGNMEPSDAVKALGALAQENRLAVFRLLVERRPDGLTPGAIAEKLDIPAPTLSFHLKELVNAGLISARQDGRFIVYTTDFVVMRKLVEFLYQNCCGVGVEGCGPECVPAINVRAAYPKLRAIRSRK